MTLNSFQLEETMSTQTQHTLGRRALTFLVLVLVALNAPLVSAQQTSSDISGYVRDSTGSILPGATVTVEYPEIGLTRQAWTTAAGFYLLPSLPNGPVVVTAELAGFKKARRDLRLELNAKARLDLT